MKKVLIVSSVASMIEQFNKDNIKILQELGYEVHVATNFENPGTISLEKAETLKGYLEMNNVKYFQINFDRNILNIVSIIKSYKELKKISDRELYSMVHCHSPIGGVITRLVFKNNSTKVIYTAHGFQFFKNGPRKDWVLFYPIEKYLSKFTDVLLTINHMDYEIANQKFKQSKVYQLPGVGIKSPKNFTKENRDKIRDEFSIPETAILITSIGELSKRKNHKVIIEAMTLMDNTNVYYLICGRGEEQDNLEEYINNHNLQERVFLLGYIDNVQELLYGSDISAFPSKREGLGLAGLEALSVGTPLLSSNVQGITDYSKDGVTGYVSNNNIAKEYKEYIEKLAQDEQLRDSMGASGKKISENFLQSNVNKIMKKIYMEI